MITTPVADVATPSMTLEVITPAKATRYLEVAAPNRPTRQGVIDQYARDMASGRFFTSTIRFGTDGQLWDGQHRLMAVVSSDVAIPFWVERNIPLEAVETIDVGLRRTVGDLLSIRGEQSANIIAGAVRLSRFLTLFPGKAPSGSSRNAASNAEILDYLADHPDLRESIPMARRVARALRFSPSTAAGLHHLESLRNPELANKFWDEIESGAEQIEDTAPYTFRQAIVSNLARPIGTRADINTVVAWAIKAWNFYEKDRPVRQLRWGRGEPFPILGKLTS